MKTIHVTASREYDVVIGAGLLDECGQRIAAAVPGAEKAVVYTDTTVFPLYAKRVTESLKAAGFTVLQDYFLAGEHSKTFRNWERILRFFTENRVSRSDVVVALGGGVVGDMVGFAAACYQRGVRLVQIPTTLLAAVDSSVGGKTAVDLPAGKNLIGAFWQPSLVICDTDTLQTLPDAVRRDGCAEIIKYGVLDGAALFSRLENSLPDEIPEDILARCVEIKRDIVAADEFDTGAPPFESRPSRRARGGAFERLFALPRQRRGDGAVLHGARVRRARSLHRRGRRAHRSAYQKMRPSDGASVYGGSTRQRRAFG